MFVYFADHGAPGQTLAIQAATCRKTSELEYGFRKAVGNPKALNMAVVNLFRSSIHAVYLRSAKKDCLLISQSHAQNGKLPKPNTWHKCCTGLAQESKLERNCSSHLFDSAHLCLLSRRHLFETVCRHPWHAFW